MAAIEVHSRLVRPLVVATVVFIASAILALLLHQFGAFANYDRLFEADPHLRVGTLASGWRTGVPDSIHALFPYLFSLPIRLLSLPVGYFGFEYSAVEIREFLALFVAPLCNALSAGIVSYIACQLGVSGWRFVAFIGIVMLAFSNVVFGSIPDHMAPTQAASMVLFLILFVQSGSKDIHRFRGAWWTMAILAPGVTITNATFVATNRFIALLAGGVTLRGAVGRAFVLAAAGMVLAVVLGVTLTTLNFGALDANPAFMNKWFLAPGAGRILEVLSAIGESFVSFALVDRQGKYPAIVHLSSLQVFWPAVALGVVTLVLAGWGGVRLSRLGGRAYWLAIAAGLHMAGTVMYLIWGDIPFLYSQHWIAGHEILLCGLVVHTAHKDDTYAAAAAAGLLAACVLSAPVAWTFIVQALAR